MRASESCLTEAMSLMCLYAYGLCSESGVYIQPTQGQCEELRDSVCQSEWATAVNFGIDLPDCNRFPASSAHCAESSNTSIVPTLENNTSSGEEM